MCKSERPLITFADAFCYSLKRHSLSPLQARHRFESGAERARTRRARAQQSLSVSPPQAEEVHLIHNLYLQGIKQTRAQEGWTSHDQQVIAMLLNGESLQAGRVQAQAPDGERSSSGGNSSDGPEGSQAFAGFCAGGSMFFCIFGVIKFILSIFPFVYSYGQ